jgi:hypothetical protein
VDAREREKADEVDVAQGKMHGYAAADSARLSVIERFHAMVHESPEDAQNYCDQCWLLVKVRELAP